MAGGKTISEDNDSVVRGGKSREEGGGIGVMMGMRKKMDRVK